MGVLLLASASPTWKVTPTKLAMDAADFRNKADVTRAEEKGGGIFSEEEANRLIAVFVFLERSGTCGPMKTIAF